MQAILNVLVRSPTPTWTARSSARLLCILFKKACACRVANEEKLERHELYESKRIAKAMLTYLARNHHLVGPLYDLLDIFTVHSRVDFSFLQTYFRDTVAQTYSLEDKRRVRLLSPVHVAGCAQQ